MKSESANRIDELIERYPVLEVNKKAIFAAVETIITAYENNKKILVWEMAEVQRTLYILLVN